MVDASFFAAALMEEEHTSFARGAMPALLTDDLAAPTLILWEMASIHDKKRRRGLLTSEEARGGLDLFLELPVRLHGEPEAMPEVLRRAEMLALTAYDAAYLELALRLDAGMATLDEPLARAARAEGIAVHSPFV